MEESRFESPLRYPGGKACLYPFFSQLFRENDLIGISYAEPYAGGSGLALKLLYNEFVSEIYINDYDYLIYSFWKSILTSNERFCEWIESVEININNWRYYKEIQKNPKMYSQFQVAQALFFLNRTNISGVIKGGPIGGLKQIGKYKINARFNKTDLIKRIKRIEKFKNRIHISKKDGVKFIKQLNKSKENIFIYLDPPYVNKGSDLYLNFYKKKDHELLSKNIEMIKHQWILSYDNTEFIANLYNKKNKLIYDLSQSASNRMGQEILIFSNLISFDESMRNLKKAIII